MSWRTGHALAIAGVLVAVTLAPALLVAALDSGSVLAPGVTEERVVTLERAFGVPAPEAADASVRFAFTRPVGLDPATDALVVVAPGTGYGNAEVDAISRFLHEGGRVLVADDGGVGADLLARLGAGVTSGTSHVYTPGFHERPQDVVTLASGEFPGLPTEVVLSRPALVTGGTPVLSAPELAFEDANENGRPDLTERVERDFVLAAHARVGAGVLLVVGDPDAVDAQRFPVAARAFLAFASENGARTLVVDEAHRPLADPAGVNALLAARAGPVAGALILTFTLVIVGVVALAPRVERAARRKRARPPRGVDPRVLAAVIGELDAE